MPPHLISWAKISESTVAASTTSCAAGIWTQRQSRTVTCKLDRIGSCPSGFVCRATGQDNTGRCCKPDDILCGQRLDGAPDLGNLADLDSAAPIDVDSGSVLDASFALDVRAPDSLSADQAAGVDGGGGEAGNDAPRADAPIVSNDVPLVGSDSNDDSQGEVGGVTGYGGTSPSSRVSFASIPRASSARASAWALPCPMPWPAPHPT